MPTTSCERRPVMAITKCRIWVIPVNLFTAPPRVMSQCARTSDWMARAGLDGQRAGSNKGPSIMSKYVTFKLVPVVGAVLALALTAAEPAHAARNDACATARAIFRANMNEARFWIGVADQFAANGNETSANQASNEANFFLGQAAGALNEMSDAC